MIRIYPHDTLGTADFGWLKARYHFSFSRYFNPDRMGFGALRVVNDDIVKAGAGFDPHPHNDMEIITFVRSGAISHRDSEGNEGRTAAGNVQVMSAGTGITHAEFNKESEDTTLYQIWIIPREKGVKPRWDMRTFPQEPAKGSLPLLVSGRTEDSEKGALYIHQDAAIYGGTIPAHKEVTQDIAGQAYILVSKGAVTIDGTRAEQGAGVEITDLAQVKIAAAENDAEIIVIDVPQAA